MAISILDVRGINPFSSISDGSILSFIDDALAWMTAVGVTDADCHTSTTLDLVNKYLAAHLAALLERQTTSEKIGSASESYGGNFGKNLDFTQYGQMAKSFDCSGILERQGKTKVEIAFFGGADS